MRYICSCGAEFDEPSVSREPHYELDGGNIYETVYVCPVCGETGFDTAITCSGCGKAMPESTSRYKVCTECGEKALSRFLDLFVSEFNGDERAYISGEWAYE